VGHSGLTHRQNPSVELLIQKWCFLECRAQARNLWSIIPVSTITSPMNLGGQLATVPMAKCSMARKLSP